MSAALPAALSIADAAPALEEPGAAPTRPRRGRPRKAPDSVARHDDRRDEILRTAAQLFATRGYEATSLDHIAEQLGMHKATLYHYIRSKHEVLYECLVKSFSDLDQVITQMHDHQVPVVQRLRRFALALARAQNNDFGRCQVLVGTRPLQGPSGLDIRAFQRRLDQTVRTLVEEGIQSGELRPHAPGMVSAMLFGTLNWVPQWYRPEGRLTLEQIVDEFLDMLTRGIATDAARA